jgi:hypothetical protein
MDFLFCKVGIAIAAMALVGATLEMSSSFGRIVARDELTVVADTIAQAIRSIDGIPGEVRIARELPPLGRQFWVDIVGTHDDMQVVRVIVDGQSRIERVIVLRNKLNGGEFELSCDGPTSVRLTKVDEICLELV